jgi:luciferase family oxidoreductase group 1
VSRSRARRRALLSVLDLCKRSRRMTAAESLHGTIELAARAEALGYERFWVAEHHTDDAAQSSPEVLLPLIGARTTSIRIGAGGILLQYYSPLKVGETFLALEALFPGRVDLGVCRGPGLTNERVARLLVDGHDDELGEGVFGAKAEALVEILRAAPRASFGGDAACAHPLGVRPPPVWVLGGGRASMELAARLGARYAYSLFFGGGLSHGPSLMTRYRERFAPSPSCRKSRGAIAVSVVCGDTESAARRLDSDLVQHGAYKSNIVGSPRQCVEAIALFAELLSVEEVFVATFVTEARARQYLYRALAEEWFS